MTRILAGRCKVCAISPSPGRPCNADYADYFKSCFDTYIACAGCLYQEGKRAYFAAQSVCDYLLEKASRTVEADFLRNIRPPMGNFTEGIDYSLKMLRNAK